MTSGRKAGFSKIDKAGLAQPIRNLRDMGLSYSEIIDSIYTNYRVALNKSNLTMFFARSENQPNRPSKDDIDSVDSFGELHVSLKRDLYDIRKTLRDNLNQLVIDIDESEMKPIPRANLKKKLKVYEKQLMNGLDQADNVILGVCSEMGNYTTNITNMLMDMSDNLCSECRKIVANTADKVAKSYEKE